MVSDCGPSMDTLPPSPLSFPLSPIEVWSQLLEHPVTCLATLATYVSMHHGCAVNITIFSTGGKLRLVSNFTDLHALT